MFSGRTTGATYNVGDIVEVSGIRFECLRKHTAGNSQYTRSPVAGFGNKTGWKIVSFAPGADNTYSRIYRYAEDVVVTQDSISYRRTSHNIGAPAASAM